MKQVRSAAILFKTDSARPQPLQPNSDGSFAPLEGARRVELHVADQQATGSFTLDRSGPGGRFLIVQTCYVNGAGQTRYTQAVSRPIRPTNVAAAPAPPPRPPRVAP